MEDPGNKENNNNNNETHDEEDVEQDRRETLGQLKGEEKIKFRKIRK